MLTCLLVVLSCPVPAAFAETPLPDGAVKGLPERLAALDDEGRAVNSETGEYFFRVEGMTLGETYTKNIQLMNLREDVAYHIYFCVEPLFKNGEIDLEDGCTCRFLLDGEEFYVGDVNGVGNIDLTEYYDCGYYAPGESHVLRCEITFNKMVIDKSIDYGWRLIDVDGVHVLRDPNGDGYVYGEIEFKWIFCAEVDYEGRGDLDDDNTHKPPETPAEGQPDKKPDSKDNNKPKPPKTGILYRDGRVWLVSMAVVAVLIVVMLVLIKKQKDKKSNHKDKCSSV